MIYPEVKLHQLYSLNFYDGLDVIFEDLEMVDMDNIRENIENKTYDRIEVAGKLFIINTVDKSIMIVGHNINNKTYMINKAGNGDIIILHYKCETQNIIKGIEYLYHMHKSKSKKGA